MWQHIVHSAECGGGGYIRDHGKGEEQGQKKQGRPSALIGLLLCDVKHQSRENGAVYEQEGGGEKS